MPNVETDALIIAIPSITVGTEKRQDIWWMLHGNRVAGDPAECPLADAAECKHHTILYGTNLDEILATNRSEAAANYQLAAKSKNDEDMGWPTQEGQTAPTQVESGSGD